MSKHQIIAGAPVRGIIPSDFDGAARIARAAVMAGFRPLSTPYGKEDPTQDEQEAAAVMIIMSGLELGLPPTQALEVIAIINGRRCVYGDGIPALLWSNGFKLREKIEGTGDDRVASCTVVRPDGEEITRTFSVSQAKKARLWDTRDEIPKYNGGKKPNDSPWYKYDERMLQMRARGWASRDGAPDVLRGLRVAEEERDHERQMRDITPANPEIDVPDVPALEQSAPKDLIDVPDIPEQEHEAIVDVEAFIGMVEDDIAGASGDAEAMADVAEKYDDDLLSRLPDDARARVEKMIEDAGQ